MNLVSTGKSPHEYRTLIREYHLDSFGHVNNAQYMALFEEARWEMFTSRGCGLEEVRRTQVGFAVLECSIRFKREMKLREPVVVVTSVKSSTEKTVTLQQVMTNSAGEATATSEVVVGCLDLQLDELIAPTAAWTAAVFGA